MIVPLRVMSDYSLLKSKMILSEFIPYLKEQHFTTCGLCDTNLFGVMEFYDLCLANNIKPIIGLEVPFYQINICLYAKNYQGYQNLLKIHTKIQQQVDITKENLNFTNILAVLDTENIEFYEELSKFFSEDNLFLGYVNTNMKTTAYLKTNQVVYLPKIRTISLKDGKYLDMLEAISNGCSLKEISKEDYQYQSFLNLQDALEDDIISTQNFANLCNLDIPKNGRYIPHYDQNIINSTNYLIQLAKKGLEKRLNGNVSSTYVNRLKYELSVINKMGFVDYFLIVYDYVKYAKKQGILVGLGRGSAAGSLVSYSLGITDVDPLKYNLLFERFLNPGRVTMPDIDIDFAEIHREEVINYVKERYGIDKTANIITFGTLKTKLAIRSVGKCLDVSSALIDAFVTLFDAKLSIKENLTKPLIKKAINEQEILREVTKAAYQIEGLKKHISTHAAGVVISSVSLDEVIPVCYNGNEVLTGITMNYLEELGLIKMDFLGLKNLTIIANVLELITKYTGQKINLNQINYDDPKVMQIFNQADTVGIFQFESTGMKNFLKKLKPSCREDIINAIALYRPGPMDNIDSFIRRKEGIEPVTYLDPSLEPILKETYGIIIYQEQIMQILVKVAKYTYSEADIVRRAMSKKKKDVMEKGQVEFVRRALANGYSRKTAEQIYELILKFANYGFNKSHSVSYALMGIQMACLKCYYPVYFIANLLNMAIDSVTKTKEYIGLAKKYQITILPASINNSTDTYFIKGDALCLPLTLIKNLGMEAVKTIILKRQSGLFTDYFDFVSRTYGQSVNRKTIEALIFGGALDDFHENHNTLLYNLDSALRYASLVSVMGSDAIMKPILERQPAKTKEELRKEEYAAYGMYIQNHPALAYQSSGIMKLNDIAQNFNRYVTCAVLIEQIRKIKTKKNEDMAFITASDETEQGNFVIFQKEIWQLKVLKEGDFVQIKGHVTKRFADYQININQIEKI